MKKPKGKVKDKKSPNVPSNGKPKPFKKAPKNFSGIEMDYELPPQDSEKWYSTVPSDPEDFPSCPIDLVNKLQHESKQMLDSEVSGYNIRVSKSSEQSWMRSVMAKGTGKDKMAAFTLMVQEKPLYNLHALQSLVGLIKPGKKECAACVDTLVELFVTDLLPPDRKLKTLSQRPLQLLDELSSGNPAGRRRRLIAWYFEDQLKSIFRDFVDSLRTIAGEAVESNKEKAIKAMAKLLESHPEQEGLLLSNLVNKMGDPSKKIASKSMHCLTQVLMKHPNMKGVIMDEVEKLLFRPNIGQKARYYGVCFLTQIMFKKTDALLAANLIKIYFGFFKACVKQGDVDSKMLSALLSGVKRAYPFAREAMDGIIEQLETLYKVVHMAPFHVALQGLSLLFQVADYKNFVSDRFYSVLYRKVLDPALCATSHTAMFLNLTFMALKKDESVPRVRAIIKRLLQVCCYMPIPMMCGTLYMISQLVHKRSALVATKLGSVVKEEGDEIKNEKQETLPAAFLEDDSEDEHYEDVPLDENGTSKKTKNGNDEKKPTAAWVHKKEGAKKFKTDAFDAMQRNPLYANGELCSYSELCLLSHHFHPTVALFASQILNNQLIVYTGDPVQDFTQIRFLERFVFKNPKKQPETSSNSLFAKRQNYSASGLKGLPLTSDKYLSQEESKIPVDERYLFRFLQRRRSEALEHKESGEDDADSDADSVGSDEFEEMLEGIMKKKGFKKDMDEDEDEDEADVDFANEYTRNMTSQKTKKKKADESDEDNGNESDDEDEFDDEFNSEDEIDDDDVINSDGDDVINADGGDVINADGDDIINADGVDDDEMEESKELDDDEDDFEFDDLDDDAEDMDFDEDSADESTSIVKGKKKGKEKDLDSLFASAEEFSELLEAAGAARDGGSGALANKDKASLKQLNWESERDRWVKGYNKFSKAGKKSGGQKKSHPMGVKRPSFKANKKKRN